MQLFYPDKELSYLGFKNRYISEVGSVGFLTRGLGRRYIASVDFGGMRMAMTPRYPTVSLTEAISRAKMIYEKEHMSTLAPKALAEAMGYKGLSGASLRMIAALRQYGLIEGRGDDAKISKDAQTL